MMRQDLYIPCTVDINYGLSLYLAADLHSLFRVHPLFNIDIIKQWANYHGYITLSQSQWTRLLETTTKLGITAHFTTNRRLTQDQLFDRQVLRGMRTPKLTPGYCVYGMQKDRTITLGSQSRARECDSKEAINLGNQLRAQTGPSLRLMEVLGDLEEGWYPLQQLRKMRYSDLKLDSIRHAMKKVVQMEWDNEVNDSTIQYPRILQ